MCVWIKSRRNSNIGEFLYQRTGFQIVNTFNGYISYKFIKYL